MWHDTAPFVTGLGRALAIDFRGNGDSQWSSERAYRTDDFVTDLEAMVEAIGADQVDLVGFSWGASVGLSFATRHPEKVRKLAIVDMPPSQPGTETDIPPMAAGFDTHQDAVEEERYVNQFASEEMLDIMASFGTRPGGDGRLVKKHDPFFLEVWPFRSDDLWNEARTVDLPVLLLHAEQSFIWPFEAAEEMAAQMKNATLVEVPASGHLIPVDNPAALGEALARFLT
jgi:pimeloyl-ACP methyl ester carboxylesterase